MLRTSLVRGLFHRCKQSVIQFVVVKPTMAVCTLTIYTMNDNQEVAWWSTTASVIYNLSYTIALYGLVRGQAYGVA